MDKFPPEKSVFDFNQMPSELKPYAVALGQRLQKPGKERISAVGTILYSGDALQRLEPVRIVWQFPLKIRLEQAGKSWTFDRNNPVLPVIGDQKVAETIQMLLEDSMEGFFAMQKNRASRRYVGSGFVLDGTSAASPDMDIVMIVYPDIFRQRQPIQKSYWFDGRTKLLGVVAYTAPSEVSTHIVIEDWREVEGEKIPFRIERWDNNKLTMRLSLNSAAVSAASEDGIGGGN